MSDLSQKRYEQFYNELQEKWNILVPPDVLFFIEQKKISITQIRFAFAYHFTKTALYSYLFAKEYTYNMFNSTNRHTLIARANSMRRGKKIILADTLLKRMTDMQVTEGTSEWFRRELIKEYRSIRNARLKKNDLSTLMGYELKTLELLSRFIKQDKGKRGSSGSVDI